MGNQERKVGLVYDPLFLQHVGPGYHPERPQRLEACRRGLERAGLWERLDLLPPRQASAGEVGRAHAPGYLDQLISRTRGQSGMLDPDTYFSPRSLEAALVASGSYLDLVASVIDGRRRTGLALVRPPGHHAEADRAMGFCLLNHQAVAAAMARERGLRVAVVDYDVHHGNGTQQIFYGDPDVLYVSIHRHGFMFFPGSGAAGETGEGAGQGATLNLPLPAGSGDREYLEAFDEQVGPALHRFAPDLLLVSAGFDGHRLDPLGGMLLDDGCYRQLAERLGGWADELCGGRWAVLLEGGYDLQALSASVVDLARCLLGQARPPGAR